MKQHQAPDGDTRPDDEAAPASTSEEFIRRYLAELEALQERNRQNALARRLVKLPHERKAPRRG